jgi:6-pyruvoyltetrahydropterin/6-carboxytetrahydropterin synthase
MFTLTKEFRFEASHVLPKHKGKCGRLHGHSWVGRVILKSRELQGEGSEAGMVMDFGDVSAVLKPLVEGKLDHYHLNETTGLENPTSEELARWVFQQLKPHLPFLFAVEVFETCTSSCRYEPYA